MGKYKDKLVALSTTADLNVPALVTMMKQRSQSELTNLLDKTMKLANAHTDPSTGIEQTLEEYVAYLKCTDLASLRANAIELDQENLDKLLSDISGAKNVYENYHNNILLHAMKALNYHVEETIACVQNPSLLETLVKDAHIAKLIPEKVRNIFASLDCNVSYPLKCRYLILHVNKKIANDPESFDMWLSVLYRHEGIHSLLDKVKACYDQSLRASSRVQASMEQLTYLEEKHVSDLTIIMTCYRDDWKKVAIFLDLPHDLIISIQSTNNNEVDCSRLVHAWIAQKYDCAKPPTLENLEFALSRISLPQRLPELESALSRLRPMTTSEILDQSLSIKIHEGSHGLLGVKVSSVSEASLSYQWYKDGEKLNDAKQAHNCYGSQECIISIFADSLILEGSYTCRIQQGDQSTTSEPIEFTIETPLDKYTKKLTDIYSTKSKIPDEHTWPPVKINTYINLALIKQQDIDNAGEYARCTIRGDADDVFKDKERIEYESVFDRLSSGARLLIEGRPGSGKTTLVHKVSQDWAKDRLKFDQVRLLFLIHLRGFLSDPNIKLPDILECYCNSPTLKDILKYADKHNGLGLCFILDGLDEYLPKKKDTFIHKLIKRSELPKALIIVASRPAAVADFRPIASRQIEVLGFLKEQISEYIKEYNFSDISKCSELLKYLDHHSNVHHMCYLPIHTAMVCFLCQADRSLPETETGIYQEFTICYFLRALRQLNDDENIYIDSIESLPSSERESYMKICKLAFEMTVSSKQVMKQKDVQNFFDAQSSRDYLGLITVDKVALKHGFQKLYTFLHFTFQEFLTAYHISNLEEEEQTKLVNKYQNAKQMQNVWKFYCGLIKFDSNKFRSLVNNTQTGTLYKVQCSFESQQPNTCATMVEDGSLCFKDKFLTPSDFTAIGFVISHATQGTLNRLVFDGCTLGPEGIEVLVKKAGEKLSLVTTLCFHGHNCAPEKLKTVNIMVHVLPSLEILDITNTQLGEEAVTALIGDGKHSNLHPNLHFLKTDAKLYSSSYHTSMLIQGFRSQCKKVINVWFPDFSKKYLSSLLSLPFYFCSVGNLSDVNMSFCKLRLVEVKILSDDLKMNSVHNRRLSLINCGITDEGAKVLSGGIGCSKLEILELNLNDIGDEGALALAHSIESCISLHTLNLSSNSIGNDGAMAIVEAIVSKHDKNFNLYLWNNDITKYGADALFQIKENINMNSLTIDGRNIGSSGVAAAVANLKDEGKDALNDFGNLLTLNLSCNSIGDIGAKKLAGALKICSHIKLTSLNLSSNSIGSDGAKALADVLKHCTVLGTLDISDNDIRVAGVKALAGALKNCMDLHTLNIACNSLHKDGAVALADLLTHCPNLCKLMIADNSIGVHGSQVLAGAMRYCKDLHILDISRNDIGIEGSEAFAGAIKQFIKLQTLDVAHNHIGEIGTRALVCAIENCTDLHTLKFSYTNIDVETIKAFATTVRYCSKLSTLHLDHCGLNNSDVQILADALKYCKNMLNLDISFNYIGIDGAKTLASALKEYHNLHSLDVSRNDIGNDGAQALAHAIKNCRNLHTLDVSHNKIGRDGAIAFADAIKHCSNLSTLELSHNNFSHDSIKAITGAIKHCSNLYSLGICNIGFPKSSDSEQQYKDEILQALSVAIRHNSNLYKLDIARNDIGGSGMKVLADAIKCCSNLHTLMLGHNKIGPEGSEALADAIKCCSNLHTLDIGYNYLADKGVKVLGKALEHCSCLHTLIVSCNTIREVGIYALSVAIRNNSNLYKLDIARNDIGGSGMKVLADAIKHCSRLHPLMLGHNKIGPEGSEALADAIKCCSNLHTLMLGHNKIGPEGSEALADAIKCCSNLHTLDVGYNYLGDKGVKVLAKALEHCSCLHTLIVSCNTIREVGIQALADAIECCSNLHTLDVGYNYLGDKGVKVLAKALEHCSCLHTLIVSCNTIREVGIHALTEAIKCHSKLHVLDISLNMIGSGCDTPIVWDTRFRIGHGDLSDKNSSDKNGGVVALADAIMCCSNNFHTLIIDNSLLTGNDINIVAKALTECSNLHVLDFSDNDIGNDGAQGITDIMKSCRKLQSLDISDTKIGKEGASAIADSIKYCHDLKTLKYDEIESNGEEVLRLAWQQHNI